MELCTAQAALISGLPHRGIFTPNQNLFRWKLSLSPLRTRPSFKCPNSGSQYYANSSLKATTSEESSSGASQYVKEETDSVATVEDVQTVEKDDSYGETTGSYVEKNDSYGAEGSSEESLKDEQTPLFAFLDKINIELDLDNPYPVLLYGGGSLITIWLASAVVGAIDSIPVFPKLMEVVGLGYSLWFGTRYLLFKKNRDELTAKIEEIKQQVMGSFDD